MIYLPWKGGHDNDFLLTGYTGNFTDSVANKTPTYRDGDETVSDCRRNAVTEKVATSESAANCISETAPLRNLDPEKSSMLNEFSSVDRCPENINSGNEISSIKENNTEELPTCSNINLCDVVNDNGAVANVNSKPKPLINNLFNPFNKQCLPGCSQVKKRMA